MSAIDSTAPPAFMRHLDCVCLQYTHIAPNIYFLMFCLHTHIQINVCIYRHMQADACVYSENSEDKGHLGDKDHPQ